MARELRMKKNWLAIAVASASFAMAGCVSVLPEQVTPDALIDLPDSRAVAPSQMLRADVTIYPPDATRAYSGVNIPVRDEQELVFLSDVRWSDASPRLLQAALVNALSRADGEGNVTPAELATRGAYGLRWRIVDLSVSRNGPVRAVVDASLVTAQTRKIVAQERFELEVSPTARSERARAAALADAAQQIANQVAEFVAANAEPLPAPRVREPQAEAQ